MSAQSRVRWIARHGLAGALLRRHARRGSLDARLMTDLQLRADPFAMYDAIRERGLISQGPFGYVSASHGVCANVLRSDTFGVGLRPESMPFPTAQVLRLGTWGAVPTPGRSAVDACRRPAGAHALPPAGQQGLHGPRHGGAATPDRGGRRPNCSTTSPPTRELPSRWISSTATRRSFRSPSSPRSSVCRWAMREQFLAWGNGAAVTLDIGISYREFRRAERDLTAMRAWMLEHFAALRRRPRRRSAQPARGREGRRASSCPRTSSPATAMLLLGAGFETTVNLIGNGTVQLVEHPEQLERLAGRAGAVAQRGRGSAALRLARAAHRPRRDGAHPAGRNRA